MPLSDDPVVNAWLRAVGLLRNYHRYEVEGLDNLDSDTSLLVVGYHGKAVAMDMILLGATMFERFGKPPRPVLHQSLPTMLKNRLGWLSGDGPELAEAVELGQHILTTPGGAREAARGYESRYRVEWGSRTGYLRLALRYGLPIVPVGASGVDDLYLAPADGYALGRRLGLPRGTPFWPALGPLGLFPFSPPFPVQIKQIVGRAIDLSGLRDDERELGEAHRSIMADVQSLMDRARALG
ncbi:MAG: acyltransferase [Polyangiaceae bacterium]|jgi:1-acyl-sn-glycerol-3-phosphate acyltransferase|nr:acyltransferase [Polyangiaceae bacterium]